LSGRRRNIISILLASAIVLFFGSDVGPALPTIPEKIIDTVVNVQLASGIIIHSNETHTLILTSYHVIESEVNLDGTLIDPDRPIVVRFIYFFDQDGRTRALRVTYNPKKICVDIKHDLALLEIETGTKLNYAKLRLDEPELGESVFLAGNPNFNYRSLGQGIISSKDR